MISDVKTFCFLCITLQLVCLIFDLRMFKNPRISFLIICCIFLFSEYTFDPEIEKRKMMFLTLFSTQLIYLKEKEGKI